MRRRICLYFNIKDLLNRWKPKKAEKKLHGVITVDDKLLSGIDAIAFLKSELAKGNNVLPCNGECGNPCKNSDKGCMGFDYREKGCPGYEIQDDVEVG